MDEKKWTNLTILYSTLVLFLFFLWGCFLLNSTTINNLSTSNGERTTIPSQRLQTSLDLSIQQSLNETGSDGHPTTPGPCSWSLYELLWFLTSRSLSRFFWTQRLIDLILRWKKSREPGLSQSMKWSLDSLLPGCFYPNECNLLTFVFSVRESQMMTNPSNIMIWQYFLKNMWNLTLLSTSILCCKRLVTTYWSFSHIPGWLFDFSSGLTRRSKPMAEPTSLNRWQSSGSLVPSWNTQRSGDVSRSFLGKKHNKNQ